MAEPTAAAKRAALGVAAVTFAALALQVWLVAVARGSLVAALLHLSQFFTILTNTLIMLTMLAIGLGRRVPPAWTGAMLLAILVVGIIYHLLLAHLWEPAGLDLVADHGLHSVVPALMLIWWLVWGDVAAVRWSDPLRWVIWPLVYCIYALARAQFSGFYPYPFLNVDELGWGGLARSIASMAVGFLVLGGVLVTLARLRQQAARTGPRSP